MGYVVRHSTSNINKARRKGNVALGTDADGYEKTSSSGFYAGVAPVEGKNNLVRTSASGDPDFYALDDTELINFANQLGGSVSHVLGAKQYLLTRDDIIFTDELPEDAITDDLVIDLDASVEASFLNNQPTTNIYPSPDLTTYSTNGFTTVTNFGNFTEVTSNGPWYGLYQRPEVVQGKTYVYSFWYKHINGATVSGGHTDFSSQKRIDGGEWSGGNIVSVPNDGNYHFIEIKFTAGSTGATSLYLQPGRGNSTTTTGHILTGNGLGVQFEEGYEATPFVSNSRTQNRIWRDLSGHGNDATLVNSPTFDPKGVISFDGVNDYAVITGSNNEHAWTADGTVGSDTFTYEIWSKGTDSNGRIISKPWNGSGRYNISIYPNYFELKVGTGVSNGPDENSNITFPNIRDGKWHQFTFWANDTQMGYYVDGGQSSNSKNHGLTGGISDYGNSQLPLGLSTLYFYGGNADGWAGNTGHANEGEIAKFKKYSKVLSLDEVRQNYYQGDIVTDGLAFNFDAGNLVSYESGSTITYNLTGSESGSLVNGAAFTSSYGGVWDLDGVDDHIGLGYQTWQFNPSTTNFSMGGWIYINTHNPANTLIQLGGSGAAHNYIGVNNSQKVLYRTRPNAGTSVTQVTSNTSINTGEWYHIFVSCDTTNAYLYINGQLDNTGTLSGMPTVTYSQYIGYYRDSAYYFNGMIGPAYFYLNKALSDSEVLQNYNAHKTRFL